MSALLAFYTIALTLAAYALGRRLHSRWPSALTTPVFFSTAVIIALLLASRLHFSDYAPARKLFGFFLGPATVALAVPLHRNRRLLAAHLPAALAGLLAGALSTLATAIALSRACGLSPVVEHSIAIKSVTAAVAVELALIVGGDPSLTAAFVVVTGMMGAMIGPFVLDRVGVRSPLARGLALGTISHGQGTAQAALESELSGAIAGVAMGLSAVFCALVAPHILAHV